MMAARPSVSLIVPTYREAENICDLVRHVKAVAADHALDLEMLVVDDRSDDGTVEALHALSEGDWLKVVVREGARSLSGAVVEGMRRSVHEILVVMDADFSHPPEAIPHLIDALGEPGVDFVLGSRFIAGGTIDREWTAARRFNSFVARLLVRPLIAVRDPTSGFFALRRERFRAMRALSPIGYKIGLELLIKGECRTVREVPIHFSERRHGTTKLGWRQRLEYLEHLRRLWIHQLRTRHAGPAQ